MTEQSDPAGQQPDRPGGLFVLEVGAVAAGGACIAHAPDGRVVFVRHALPGEQVRVRVTDARSSYLRADAVEVLRASPERVEPPCEYARPGRCGGCDWQHAALPEQRRLKAELVREQLWRVARVELPVTVEEVPGSADGLSWRTRVQWSVDAAGRPGLHRHRSAALELVESCPIAVTGAQVALRHRWPGAATVETTALSGQVASSVHGRLRTIPEVDGGLVVGDRPVRSPQGVRVEVRGRRYEVAAGVFWQVHPAAAEVLADAVLEDLRPQPGDRVVDLYAGVGLFAAQLGVAVGAGGSVLALEGAARAAADAARNTDDLPWVKVRTAEVDGALVAGRIGRPDLVVLDPPRTGAGVEVSAALAALRPKRIAYVSCDAVTFSRDLRVFLDSGYRLSRLRAYDLFPMTEHVELVGLLEPV